MRRDTNAHESRRTFLKTVTAGGAAGLVGLAGCVGGVDDDNGDENGDTGGGLDFDEVDRKSVV